MKEAALYLNDYQSEGQFLISLLREFRDAKANGRSKMVAHLNAHGFNLAYKSIDYLKLLNAADVLFVDSKGFKIALKLFGWRNFHFAATPPDWMHSFYKLLPKNTRLCIIGDEPEVIEEYRDLVCASFSHIDVVFSHHGFFQSDENAETKVVNHIRELKPDILLVGMGMPRQEFWIQKIQEKIAVPLMIPVGAYFQRMTGKQKRPPRILVNLGLEWIHRFLSDPMRLFKRYIIGNPLVICRMIKNDIKIYRRTKA